VIAFPIVLIIVTGVVACCVPRARQAPFDTICLLVFILSFSYVMSFFCSLLVDDETGPIVPMAVLATVAITLALTVYAFVCRGNFLVWIGIILVCAAGALIFGIMSIFFYFPVLIYVYCSLLIVIFGIYLVILTKMVIGGGVAEFPMDNPILASLFLYLYIMRIFMYILIMFGARR
jgi:protein lifeguard